MISGQVYIFLLRIWLQSMYSCCADSDYGDWQELINSSPVSENWKDEKMLSVQKINMSTRNVQWRHWNYMAFRYLNAWFKIPSWKNDVLIIQRHGLLLQRFANLPQIYECTGSTINSCWVTLTAAAAACYINYNYGFCGLLWIVDLFENAPSQRVPHALIRTHLNCH